jgi:FixJ family two-component response regulator
LSTRKSVFVVDDDPSMLRGMKRLLREHGFDTGLFASGEALLRHGDFGKAFCIILDIMESGCIAYLTKPFAAQSLIEPIERVRAAVT